MVQFHLHPGEKASASTGQSTVSSLRDREEKTIYCEAGEGRENKEREEREGNAGTSAKKERRRGKLQGEEREGLFYETGLERAREKGREEVDRVHAAIRKEAARIQRDTVRRRCWR